MHIYENFSLKKFNTFGVDATTHWFAEISDMNDLDEIVRIHYEKKIAILPLGCGSNILFTKDFDGLTIKIGNKGIKIISQDENSVVIDVAAGELWEDLIHFCITNNYSGLENLTGIPGQVGSSPIQNIGAYGTEVKSCIKEVYAVSIDDGCRLRFSADECRFGYRSSIFKHELKDKVIITNVVFLLSKQAVFTLNYGGVAEEVRRIRDGNPDLASVSQAILNIRNRKIPDPAKIGSAGSFFKNPQIDEEQFTRLITKFPTVPNYPAPDNRYKLAAAWLIEQCGWKGYRKGDAGVNEMQPLILVNYGKATGAEIVELSHRIQESVYEKFGVLLEPEVNIL